MNDPIAYIYKDKNTFTRRQKTIYQVELRVLFVLNLLVSLVCTNVLKKGHSNAKSNILKLGVCSLALVLQS